MPKHQSHNLFQTLISREVLKPLPGKIQKQKFENQNVISQARLFYKHARVILRIYVLSFFFYLRVAQKYNALVPVDISSNKVVGQAACKCYFFFFFLYYIGIRIIDNGASRRRTRNARFRARRADHSTTSMRFEERKLFLSHRHFFVRFRHVC